MFGRRLAPLYLVIRQIKREIFVHFMFIRSFHFGGPMKDANIIELSELHWHFNIGRLYVWVHIFWMAWGKPQAITILNSGKTVPI